MLRPFAAALALAALVLPVLTGCAASPAPAGPEGVLATITTPPTAPPGRPRPSASRPERPRREHPPPADGWYLALGDSLAAGLQPTTGDQPTRGYAGPVLAGLQQSRPGTALKNLGCSGETTGSMLRGGLCRYPEGSQVAAATAFLAANPGRVPLRHPRHRRQQRPALCDPRHRPGLRHELDHRGARPTSRPSCPGCGRRRPRPRSSSSPTTTRCWPPTGRARPASSSPPSRSRCSPISTGPSRPRPRRRGQGRRRRRGVRHRRRPPARPRSPRTSPGSARGRGCATRNDIHANDEGYAAMARAVLAAR